MTANKLFRCLLPLAFSSVTACLTLGPLPPPSDQLESSRIYEKEKVVRNDSSTSPRECLALSGGGVRAAFYSIGVMKALSKHGRLDTLDYISSVSGGSYAASWYYVQQMHYPNNADSKFLFDTGPLYEATQNADVSHMASYDFVNIWLRLIQPAWALWDLAFVQPLKMLLNWQVSRFGPPESLFFVHYEDRIGEIFWMRPRTKEHYIPAAETPALAKLGDFIKERRLPIFIINATLQSSEKFSPRDPRHVFEITPWYRGSDSVGFTSEGDQDLLSKYVVASGAALDLPEAVGWAEARLYSGIRTGVPFVPPDSGRAEPGTVYYLSDGGHSENLGVISLIRRRCQHIIVVDAEHDPFSQFEGYDVLRDLVRQSFNATMKVQEIDDRITTLPPNKKLPAELRIGWTKPIMSGGTVTGGALTSEIRLTYLKLSTDPTSHLAKEAIAYYSHHANDSNDSRPSSQSHPGCTPLVSLDTGSMRSPIPELYYSKNVTDMLDRSIAPGAGSYFPQYTTLDQWLTEDKILGLVDLGFAHMMATLCADVPPPLPTNTS